VAKEAASGLLVSVEGGAPWARTLSVPWKAITSTIKMESSLTVKRWWNEFGFMVCSILS
jgi:hypothetical protein